MSNVDRVGSRPFMSRRYFLTRAVPGIASGVLLAACAEAEATAPTAVAPTSGVVIPPPDINATVQAAVEGTAAAAPTANPEGTAINARSESGTGAKIEPEVTAAPTIDATDTPTATEKPKPTEVKEEVQPEVLLRRSVTSEDGTITLVTTIFGDDKVHREHPDFEFNAQVGGENGVLTKAIDANNKLLLSASVAASRPGNEGLNDKQVQALTSVGLYRFGSKFESGATSLNNPTVDNLKPEFIGYDGKNKINGGLTEKNITAFMRETEKPDGDVDTIAITVTPDIYLEGSNERQILETLLGTGIVQVETLIIVKHDEGANRWVERYFYKDPDPSTTGYTRGVMQIEAERALATYLIATAATFNGHGTLNKDFTDALADVPAKIDQETNNGTVFEPIPPTPTPE